MAEEPFTWVAILSSFTRAGFLSESQHPADGRGFSQGKSTNFPLNVYCSGLTEMK